MEIKEFNYQKKNGEVKSYSALVLNETEKDIFAIVLDTVSAEDREKLDTALSTISEVIEANKKTSFRKFLKESVVAE